MHFLKSLLDVIDDFSRPFIIQSFRVTHLELIVTTFSGADVG